MARVSIETSTQLVRVNHTRQLCPASLVGVKRNAIVRVEQSLNIELQGLQAGSTSKANLNLHRIPRSQPFKTTNEKQDAEAMQVTPYPSNNVRILFQPTKRHAMQTNL